MKLQRFSRPRLPVPFVLLSFKGQLLIQPVAGGQSCKIGVNHHTKIPHKLNVAFLAVLPNGQSRTIALLTDRLEDTFSIEVTPKSKGVFGFVPTPGEVFDRSSASSDSQDLRWAIDLQNPNEFHDFDLEFTEVQGEFGFLMRDGVFYTLLKSDPRTLFVDRARPGDVLPLVSIATHIGAIIEPPAAGQNVLVKWKENGSPKSEQLPRQADPDGTFYTISAVNEPPLETPGVVHDELDEYYEVLTKANGSPILANERFKLETIQTTSFDGDRLPCMSIFLGE
jgi:hypothetical protein